ncbi:MAG: hypothetical protein KDK78_04640 [Chlamydiia bacterium]|nr:hypothetical protein [Chlamydiia bacterium]
MRILNRPDGQTPSPPSSPIPPASPEAQVETAVPVGAQLPCAEYDKLIQDITEGLASEIEKRQLESVRFQSEDMSDDCVDMSKPIHFYIQYDSEWIEVAEVTMWNEENESLHATSDLIDALKMLCVRFTFQVCFDEEKQEAAEELAEAIQEEGLTWGNRLAAYNRAMDALNGDLAPFKEICEAMFNAAFLGEIPEAADYLEKEATWPELRSTLNILLGEIQDLVEAATDNPLALIMAAMSYHLAFKPALESIQRGCESRFADEFKGVMKNRLDTVKAHAEEVFGALGGKIPGGGNDGSSSD